MDYCKGTISVGQNSLSTSIDCRKFDVTNWPTYLNIAVTKGDLIWEMLIDEKNYHFTAQMYTNPKYCKYRKWIMEKNWINRKNVLGEIAASSQSLVPCFKTECDEYSEEELKIILNKALLADNLPLLKALVSNKEQNPKFIEDAFTLSLSYCCRDCVGYLCGELQNNAPKSLDGVTWAHLAHYQDHLVISNLKKFLMMTPCTQDYFWYMKMDKVAFGSLKEVKKIWPDCSTFCLKISLLSRLPYASKDFVEYYFDSIYRQGLHKDPVFVTDLVAFTLSSHRSQESTEKIIALMSSKGFPFEKVSELQFCSITSQSWKAIINNKEFFDFCKIKVDGKLLRRRTMIQENRKFLKEILEMICPFLDNETITSLFMELGSSIAKWGYKKGYLKKLNKDQSVALEALKKGNLPIAEVIFQRHEQMGVPIKYSEFQNEYIHFESLAYLNCRSRLSQYDKRRLLSDDHGDEDYFFDTSIASNNPALLGYTLKTYSAEYQM